jgi:hypothetical protein
LRSSAAKFWVERRCAEIVANFDHAAAGRTKTNSQPALFAVNELTPQHPHRFLPPDEAPRARAAAARLVPSRAPPSQLFLMA